MRISPKDRIQSQANSEIFIFLANVELVHPLPATAEDELGVDIQTTEDAANTAAGSGLHDAVVLHLILHVS